MRMEEGRLQLCTSGRRFLVASMILAVDQVIFGPASFTYQRRVQQLDRGKN